MPTQIEIAQHLDMSDRNVRDVLNGLADEHGWPRDWWKDSSLDIIRVRYIKDLREKAAGRGGSGQQNLTEARTREAQVNTMSKELQLAKDAELVVETAVFEEELGMAIVSARQQFMNMSEGLKAEIDARYEIDLDATIIDDAVYATMSELAKYDPEQPALS